MVKRILVLCVIYLVCNSALPVISEATDPQVLKLRVPADQIDEVRTWVNPFSSNISLISVSDFFPRFGGGIGVTRMISALDKLNSKK